MKPLSLKDRILAYYRKNAGTWISGGEIERLVAARTNYKSSNSSRRLRELHEDGLLSRKEVKGTVYYAYLPQTRTVERVVVEGTQARRIIETVTI